MSGGEPTYTFLWDSGETDSIAQNLSSGYRHVSLTDDWGCVVMDSIYISENPEIQPTVSLVQTVSCYGDTNGIVTVSSFGGVAPHTFFWSQLYPAGNTSNPDTVVGLAEGSYYVTTQDALGCEVLDSIYVSEPDPLTMQANALAWISCNGANDGLAYATAQGGNTPYVFTWGNGQIGDTINTVTPLISNVTVVDNRGCMNLLY